MRRLLLVALPVALAACSPESQSTSEGMGGDSAADVGTRYESGPSAGLTSAPGVAFAYRYAFSVPAARIHTLQDDHAAACEQLGINRCRITGLRYEVRNENDVDAMLAFKLDPAIARQFGKSGSEAVADADGSLLTMDITGEDAGAAIKTVTRDNAKIAEEIRRIEAQLAQKGLAPAERDRLQAELLELRQKTRANQETREGHERSLATTPMTFRYESANGPPPIRETVRSAGTTFVGGLSALLIVLITVSPWVAFGALVWMAIRLLTGRWMPRRPAAVYPTAG